LLLEQPTIHTDTQDWHGNTPLHLAAQEGHAAAVRLLALHGANMNGRTTAGFTPLHTAAASNRVEVLHLFLYYGLQLETPSLPNGDTPLMCAAMAGATAAFEFLLRVGANPTAVNVDGNSVLHLCAACGDSNGVRLLLDMKVSQLNRNANGDLPIHLAAYFGHSEVIALLVEASPIIIKYGNAQKYLPLHLAALNHQRSAISLLLQYVNPDVLLKDPHGMTPFHFSCMSGSDAHMRRHMVEIFDLVSNRNTTLTLSEIINSYDATGYTPLHWAAISQSPEAFELLALDTGGGNVELTTRDSFQHSILHLLAGTNNLPAVQCYYERTQHSHPLDFLPVDTQGRTPLTLAINNNFTDLAEYLLTMIKHPGQECELPVNVDTGLSLLHLAVFRRNAAIVKLLLQHVQNVSPKTAAGETPLDWAVELGETAIAQLLRARQSAASAS
jgi:cytohesin